VGHAVLIGVGAQASAEQIALQCMQMRAIRDDPAFHGGDYYDIGDGRGPIMGMGMARRIGHLSYRSELEMHDRFANRPQPGEDTSARDRSGRFAVESYLDHAATRLVRRFDPNTYLALNEAMNHHDIGRGRGGIAEAMSLITAELTIVGLDGDRLYPLRLQEELAALAPKAATFEVVHSTVGHDAFLIEDEQMSDVIRRALHR
jgi:homoserine O-acetyltransferase